MKKICLFIALCFMSVCASAQVMRAEELEKYAVSKYGDKWTEAAQNIASQLTLDKNNSLTYVQVIDCGEQTKDQLYVKMNYWFTATFNDANSVIKLNDKESGEIISTGYVADIAGHAGGMNSYIVSIRPIIKVDIKDKKIRVTYTVQDYEVTKMIGGGVHAGPNAVLALAREGYDWRTLSPRDIGDYLAWPGLWRLGRRFWRTGAAEVVRSLSHRRFLTSLRELVPDLPDGCLTPAPAGVRAQALRRDGTMVDDFAFLRADRQIHVLNAPSPAATASLEIGRSIADEVDLLRGD